MIHDTCYLLSSSALSCSSASDPLIDQSDQLQNCGICFKVTCSCQAIIAFRQHSYSLLTEQSILINDAPGLPSWRRKCVGVAAASPPLFCCLSCLMAEQAYCCCCVNPLLAVRTRTGPLLACTPCCVLMMDKVDVCSACSECVVRLLHAAVPGAQSGGLLPKVRRPKRVRHP